MKGAPIGRPPLPEGERTVKLSVSLPAALVLWLKALPNRSEFIAQAIAEKIRRER
jgi:metal-responsive CopG/Arc/MetJ family transcriptional regulator